jgi:hypothetical protein
MSHALGKRRSRDQRQQEATQPIVLDCRNGKWAGLLPMPGAQDLHHPQIVNLEIRSRIYRCSFRRQSNSKVQTSIDLAR